MPQFLPDQVSFNDFPGYGAWDIGHHREHLQFVQILSQQTPPVNIPDYDFQTFLTGGSARKWILESHYEAHQLLRGAFGLNGIDLQTVNLDAPDAFYDWLGYHSQEHALIRQQLGVT